MDLLQWSINFLIKKASGSGIKNENMSDHRPLNLAPIAKVSDHTQQLAKELHKPFIRKFKKRTLNFYRQYLGSRCSRYAINT